MVDPNGHVLTHGSQEEARVTGQHAAYSKSAMSEGVVVAKYAIDDDGNFSKKYTEYDVKELQTGQVFRNCRRLSESGGVDSGDDIPLRPAQKSADLSSVNAGVFDPLLSPLLSSDGDHVALAFLKGSQDSAVICGVIPHTKSAYGNKKSDGNRKFTVHKGVSVEITEEGAYIITRHLTPNAPGQPVVDDENTSSITIAPDGEIQLSHVSGASINMLPDGSIHITSNERIFLGEPASDEGILEGAVHASGIDPFTGLTYGQLNSASRLVMVEK